MPCHFFAHRCKSFVIRRCKPLFQIFQQWKFSFFIIIFTGFYFISTNCFHNWGGFESVRRPRTFILQFDFMVLFVPNYFIHTIFCEFHIE
ncbi:hypothetical protein [Bufonid herpesvirus 1]|uniref:hypothetical protein n=1 Tax=Bufonid herpesvirus 1 TaxID=2282206 RepID=UPI000EB6253C|nr:hypothetical protein [Bufonid herpesvirus 1]AXF48570.1 hypothetical protein [Bufonid herpesvirus 1]